MSYSVELEPGVVNSAARFLKDDPAGLNNVLDAFDALADNPRPVDSSAFGAYRRLRIGLYRALYTVEDEKVRMIVLHLGRTP